MSRLPLRGLEILAVVVALVLGYLVTDHVPVINSDSLPFVRSIAAGRVAHLSYADERVLDVRTSQYLGVDPLLANKGVDLVKPAGIFLLVTVELTPLRENTVFGSAWLIDDQGRKFRTSEKSTCTSAPQGLTGRPTYNLYCFEVPPDLLGQFRIEIARTSDQDPGSGEDDEVADLDLGITAAKAAQLAATTTTYEAVPSSQTPLTLKVVRVEQGSS